MRTLFLISLADSSTHAWEMVEEYWPDNAHCIIDDRTAIVAAPQATTSQVICDLIGMDDTYQVMGFVVEMSNFFGFHDRGIWEWADKANSLP